MALTPIKIGVAGLGAVAQSVHLPLIRRRWDLFELTAIADLSAETTARVGSQYGIPATHQHRTLTDMLAAEHLDGVLILTSGSHGGGALQCVRQGVAVFCEKPLAYSQAEIKDIAAAEAAHNRPLLLLAYMKEYDSAVNRLRTRLPEPSEIRTVTIEVLHPSDASQLAFANLHPPANDVTPETLAPLNADTKRVTHDAIGTETGAAFERFYTDVLLGSLIHNISLLRTLFGPLATIETATRWATQQDHPGSLDIRATLPTGARVHISWHYIPNYPTYRETLTVHHNHGTLSTEFAAPYLLNRPTLLRETSADGNGETTRIIADTTEAFETELAAFHAMVVKAKRPLAGTTEGTADIRTAQHIAALLARENGIPIAGEAGNS